MTLHERIEKVLEAVRLELHSRDLIVPDPDITAELERIARGDE